MRQLEENEEGNVGGRLLAGVRLLVLLLCVAGVVGVGGVSSKATGDEAAQELSKTQEGRENKVVRVGYYTDNEAFQVGDNDSMRKTGYAYEYYQEIAKHAGWKYEYVYGSWQEIYQKLLSGEVDIMAGIGKNDARSGQILFADNPMGGATYYLFLPADRKDISENNLSALNGAKIGTKKNSSMRELLKEYAKKNHFECEIISYSDLENRLDDLANGKLDAILTVENDWMAGYRPALKVGSADFYFAVNKNRPDILEELNEAQDEIITNMPNYDSRLSDKYFSRNSVARELSEKEKVWMREHQSLKVGYLKGYMPFSDLDEESEKLTGILPEFLKYFSDFMGVKFTEVAYGDYNLMIQGLENGDIDVVFPTYGDIWYAESQNYTQTASVASTPISVVYKGDYSGQIYKRIAVSEGSPLQAIYLSTNYPEAEQVLYPDWEACMQAIESGEVGCMLINSALIRRYINEYSEFSDLKVVEQDDIIEFCFAVRRSDPILYSILDKGLSNIDDAWINDVLIRNSSVEPEYTFRDFLLDNILIVCAGVVGFFLILIVFFVLYRNQASREKAILQEAYDKEKEYIASKEQAQVALQDAYESANRANRAKSDFLARMSHDIRTPMNAIIGMTAIAEAHADEKERVSECLEKIKTSGKHLLTLINEVLDVSKIESGKLGLTEEEFNLRSLIEEMLDMMRPQVLAKKHQLKLDTLNIRHEDVIGDSLHLQQVFVNIMGNAVKYTNPGGTIGLKVTEKVTNQPKIGCYEFVFEDTGIGMSPEYMEHIFEPFSRENASSHNAVQGTGLGLSIVNNIVRMMGGNIQVESEKGKGSRFTVTFYLRIQEEKNISFEGLVEHPVLVVDDSKEACKKACELLRQIGIKGEWVQNGQEAVTRLMSARVENKEYYAVLMARKISGMDGVDTTRTIRQMFGKDIRVILMSGYDWSDLETEGKQAGVDAFISKPLFKSRLSALFKRLVDEGRQRDRNSLDHIKENEFAGKRVLLVEDNEINAEIAEEMLGMSGLEVAHAWNGEEALAMLSEAEPEYYDMIFMDIQMPLMDGYEATRRIRGGDREDLQKLPIVAMTANAFAEDIQKAMQAGMDEHLVKPLEVNKLVDVLRKFLADDGNEKKE